MTLGWACMKALSGRANTYVLSDGGHPMRSLPVGAMDASDISLRVD
jgi:hypothetical protein